MVDALARAVRPCTVTAIVNVGDDLEFLGLQVSPDLDTVLYTLAGLLDEGRGWGVRDETTNALATAERLGAESWFASVTGTSGSTWCGYPRFAPANSIDGHGRIAAALGVETRLLPASDERVRTIPTTDAGELDFQNWFVRRRHTDPVLGVRSTAQRPRVRHLGSWRPSLQRTASSSRPRTPSSRSTRFWPCRVSAMGWRATRRGCRRLADRRRSRAARPLAEMLSGLGHEPSDRGRPSVRRARRNVRRRRGRRGACPGDRGTRPAGGRRAHGYGRPPNERRSAEAWWKRSREDRDRRRKRRLRAGLATRLRVLGEDVVLGSRNPRGELVPNVVACQSADPAFLSVPPGAVEETVQGNRDRLAGKIVVSVVPPSSFATEKLAADPGSISLAEIAQRTAPASFATCLVPHISAKLLARSHVPLDEDVLLAGDDPEAKAIVVVLAGAAPSRVERSMRDASRWRGGSSR